jgi:hypothetical protein
VADSTVHEGHLDQMAEQIRVPCLFVLNKLGVGAFSAITGQCLENRTGYFCFSLEISSRPTSIMRAADAVIISLFLSSPSYF